MFHQIVPLTLLAINYFCAMSIYIYIYIYIYREREREREREHGLQKASYLDDHSFKMCLVKQGQLLLTMSRVTAI